MDSNLPEISTNRETPFGVHAMRYMTLLILVVVVSWGTTKVQISDTTVTVRQSTIDEYYKSLEVLSNDIEKNLISMRTDISLGSFDRDLHEQLMGTVEAQLKLYNTLHQAVVSMDGNLDRIGKRTDEAIKRSDASTKLMNDQRDMHEKQINNVMSQLKSLKGIIFPIGDRKYIDENGPSKVDYLREDFNRLIDLLKKENSNLDEFECSLPPKKNE